MEAEIIKINTQIDTLEEEIKAIGAKIEPLLVEPRIQELEPLFQEKHNLYQKVHGLREKKLILLKQRGHARAKPTGVPMSPLLFPFHLFAY